MPHHTWNLKPGSRKDWVVQGAQSDDTGHAESGEGQGDQQGEPQMDYAEAWTEEDAQAMEQWLRRIPDDPGGLLRRKFRNQHQRRGADADLDLNSPLTL